MEMRAVFQVSPYEDSCGDEGYPCYINGIDYIDLTCICELLPHDPRASAGNRLVEMRAVVQASFS